MKKNQRLDYEAAIEQLKKLAIASEKLRRKNQKLRYISDYLKNKSIDIRYMQDNKKKVKISCDNENNPD